MDLRCRPSTDRLRAIAPIRSFLLFTLALLVAASCSSNVETDPDADPELGCGTFSENDCEDGQVCFGAPSCDAVWTCQSENPCSAAGPELACGCDGSVTQIAAGCPERHAWELSEFGGITALGGAQVDGSGAPCDPALQSPFTVTVAIRGLAFDAYEGGSAWIRAAGGAQPAWAPETALPVAAGEFSYASSSFTHAAGDAYYAYVLMDRNGDGACDPEDDVVWAPERTIDAVDMVIGFDLTPPSPGEVQPSLCESW